jgi:glycopeptide antibiotics resistance protein
MRQKSGNSITSVLLIIYFVALLWILLLKLGVRFSYMEQRSINLIPFGEQLLSRGRPDIAELILNVIVFVPLGVYSGALFKRWGLRNKALFFFLTSLTIEGIQYTLSIGAFDITDLITNTTGGLIGLMIFASIQKLFSDKMRAQKFVNIVGAAGTILMVSLLVLLKLNMLPIKYQ